MLFNHLLDILIENVTCWGSVCKYSNVTFSIKIPRIIKNTTEVQLSNHLYVNTTRTVQFVGSLLISILARVDLNESEKLLTNTTVASKCLVWVKKCRHVCLAQNFDTSLLTNKFWLVFFGMKQKKSHAKHFEGDCMYTSKRLRICIKIYLNSKNISTLNVVK